MSSTAIATFNVKNLRAGIPPGDTDVAVASVLKKKFDDTTLWFSFTDATLKDPSRGQGILLGAERKLSDGVKAALVYDLPKRSAIGSVAVDKSFDNGSNLQLKAIYRQAGDQFALEETWRLDGNNKITGHYNFKTEEAIFGYTYTKNDWTATARYNFQKDTTVFEVERKQNKNRFGAVYAPKDEAATLFWSAKPFRAALKGRVGKGGVVANSAFLTVTHEFDL